jgi:Protein of unknown function (DUF2838)
MADNNRGKRKFTELVKGQHQKLRSKFRKAITGDESKRVRDHVQEQPDYVKLLDKIAFTLGLLNILACEYFLVKLPTYFWLWYSLVIPLLILTRISHFKSLGWQYFLLDFCYFVLFCVFVNLYFFSDSQIFFKICFMYANGPLTWAIVIWRNSLVFHDYDKITSVYIHFLPCVLYYAWRWHGHDSLAELQSRIGRISGDCMKQNCRLSEASPSSYENIHFKDIVLAAFGYLFWQMCYFAKTEILDKRKLDERPELLTSLRWMSTDKKNFFARFVLSVCRNVGLLRFDEHFDCYSVKTKIIFMSAQFLYSITTFAPTILLYNFQICHVAFLIFIFCAAAFNGASFYIEVFSKVYQLKIEKLLEMRKLAELAARTPFDSTNSGNPYSSEANGHTSDERPSPPTEAYSPVSDVSGIFTQRDLYLAFNEDEEKYEGEYSSNYKEDLLRNQISERKVLSAPCVEIFDEKIIKQIQGKLK